MFLVKETFFFSNESVEYQTEELICRIVPSFILLFQLFPSLAMLYYYGFNNIDYKLRLKVIGHQWYWSYEYRDIKLRIDSYMKSVDRLSEGEERLLEVDNRFVVPESLSLSFNISRRDVIHAWSLSRMGLKIDAMRGILRVINFNFPYQGIFYGQCSEICGSNHRFIPIELEVVNLKNFLS